MDVIYRENYDYLSKAYSAFGVPREIITAIIESKHDTENLGKFKTFDTLASLSVGPNKGRRANFYRTELINFYFSVEKITSIQRQLLAHTRGH